MVTSDVDSECAGVLESFSLPWSACHMEASRTCRHFYQLFSTALAWVFLIFYYFVGLIVAFSWPRNRKWARVVVAFPLVVSLIVSQLS